MALSKRTIEELQQILKEEYGRDLTLQQTSEIAYSLTGWFDLLAKINYKNNQNEYEQHLQKQSN